MARISMRNVQKSPVSEYFDLFLSSAAARGIKDKTLSTYKQHFHSISKRLDVTLPLNRLNTAELDKMVLSMREEGLSASSINSYTRTLKVFFSWCNEEGHTDLNIKIFKAPETVKEVYTDKEPLILLKKPEANCNFCESELGYHQFPLKQRLSGCHSAEYPESGCRPFPQTDCAEAHEKRQGSGHPTLFSNGFHSKGLHGSSFRQQFGLPVLQRVWRLPHRKRLAACHCKVQHFQRCRADFNPCVPPHFRP